MKTKACLGSLVLFAFLLAVAFPQLANAEVYMKQKRHTDETKVMGKTQPAKDEIVITWLGKDRARMDHDQDKSTIILLDKNVIISLDHTKMTYTEMQIGEWEKTIEESVNKEAKTDEDKEGAKKALGFLKGLKSLVKFETKVTETNEAKRIKDWSCRKYILKANMPMVKMTSEIWATEDIRVDFNLYRKISNAMLAGMPGMQESLKEMEKIKGVMVYSESSGSAMGADVKSTEELLEITDKAAPAGAYEIPKGYVKAKA
jgi:hypothetical protein